jgi:hypothetical protein
MLKDSTRGVGVGAGRGDWRSLAVRAREMVHSGGVCAPGWEGGKVGRWGGTGGRQVTDEPSTAGLSERLHAHAEYSESMPPHVTRR